MARNEIDEIKNAEAAAIARREAARHESEARIYAAEKDARELLRKRKEEADDTVLSMRLEAEEAAIAEADRIREHAREKADDIKKQRSRNIPDAVRFILDGITGERDVSTSGDAEGNHRGS
jgi:vacuolar-type H+-ATPase subunit H